MKNINKNKLALPYYLSDDARLIVVFLLHFASFSLSSQSTFSSAGADVTGLQGSVSYTIGQVAYQTISGLNGSVLEGVQQPFEITVISTIVEPNNSLLKILIYPNPTSTHVNLKFNYVPKTNIYYKLMDISGKIFDFKRISHSETIIPFDYLASSIYFVQILELDSASFKEIKTFKIIKN